MGLVSLLSLVERVVHRFFTSRSRLLDTARVGRQAPTILVARETPSTVRPAVPLAPQGLSSGIS